MIDYEDATDSHHSNSCCVEIKMLIDLLEERFKTFSAAFLVLLLGLSGLTIILWMAGAGWQDNHGIVVSTTRQS